MITETPPETDPANRLPAWLERTTRMVQRMGQAVNPFTQLAARIDVLDASNRRQRSSSSTQSVDQAVPDNKRLELTQTARDIQRNFSIAAWAIRKHLDFVASHNFEPQTGDTGLDRELENLMAWWGRKENCDVANRHSLHKIVRLSESCRIMDGDLLLLKLRGGKLQPIEGDRIRTPGGMALQDLPNGLQVFNGVAVNSAGRAQRWAVHKRATYSGMQFERWIPDRNIIQHAWFDRFDQYRGVSPIVSALAPLQDVYENFSYALAKSKAAQLFGLVFYRDAAETGELPTDGEDTDGDGIDDRYNVELGTRPLILDLQEGDDAKFLENKTPSIEFQDFNTAIIGVALKALDIPFSFYDESFTNFFGSMAALNLYVKSAADKRLDVQELLRQLTIWRLRLFIEDGDLQLPSGMTLGDLKWEWIPSGLPWWRPKEEIAADIMAIQGGLKTREMVCRDRYGLGFRELAERLQKEDQLIDELGLALSTDLSVQVQVGGNPTEDPADA